MAPTQSADERAPKRKRNTAREVVFTCPGCRIDFNTVEELRKHCKNKFSRSSCQLFAYRTLRHIEWSCRRVMEVEEFDQGGGDSGERRKRQRVDRLSPSTSPEAGDDEGPNQKRSLHTGAVREESKHLLAVARFRHFDDAGERTAPVPDDGELRLPLRFRKRKYDTDKNTRSAEENEQHLSAERDRAIQSMRGESDQEWLNAQVAALEEHQFPKSSHDDQAEYEYNGHSSFMREGETDRESEQEEGAEDRSFPNTIDSYLDFDASQEQEGHTGSSGEETEEVIAGADNPDPTTNNDNDTSSDSDDEGVDYDFNFDFLDEEEEEEEQSSSLPYPNYTPDDHEDGEDDPNDPITDQLNLYYGNITPAQYLQHSRNRLRGIAIHRVAEPETRTSERQHRRGATEPRAQPSRQGPVWGRAESS